MKVLFTTNIPSPYRINFFNKLGTYCELTVLCERVTAKDRNDKWLNNKNINFNIKYLKGIKIGNETALCPEIIKHIKKYKYDMIVVGGYSTPTGMLTIKYLKDKKIPFILNCDGGFIKDESKIKNKIKKYFISSANGWLSTGEMASKYLEYYGAKKDKIFKYPFTSIEEQDIIYDTMETHQKEQLRKKLNIDEKNVIITVGQFIYRKGIDILINASSYFSKDIGVYIIGGEPSKEYIELKDKLKAKNIHFVGFKQKDELKEYYKAADIFVLPTREDIWGLVINEAMAYGLPVITTDKCIAGLELIEDTKNGYIVSVEEQEELANKITHIINNDKLKEEMSKNNINKIKKYTIENMSKEHIRIFKEILKDGN